MSRRKKHRKHHHIEPETQRHLDIDGISQRLHIAADGAEKLKNFPNLYEDAIKNSNNGLIF